MTIEAFEKLPVMGILRGIKKNMISPLVETLVEAGLTTIEITMNTDEAAELIKEMDKTARGRLFVGAGTVLHYGHLEDALSAGASFIVMPVIVDDVVEYCVKNNIPVFPGALTPNEIYRAWNMGATMVKVFPAKVFGIDYFKEVKAPLNNIKLMATGGVTAENAGLFFSHGADAVSFGASIFKPQWLQNADYQKIGQGVKKMVNACKNT